MSNLVSMAGSSGPLELTQGARKMSDVKTQEVLRRPRGRPRKNPDVVAHDQKKRGSQTSHGAEHYAEIRYKRALAGIMHKQFRILVEDEAEAERLMSKLLDKAKAAYHEVSLKDRAFHYKADADGASAAEIDSLVDDLAPVTLPQEPSTASLPEIEAAPPPGPAEKPKPIRERGKLTLKAFRKDAP